MTQNLAQALVTFQAGLPKITKAATADTGKYKYKYATLDDITEAVMPLLTAVGLAWSCGPGMQEGHFGLIWRLLHISGEQLDGFMPLPANAPPQQLGGCITYFRRYSMCSVLGVTTDEDDDGAKVADAWESARPAARGSSGPRAGARARSSDWKGSSNGDADPGPLTSAQSKRMHASFTSAGIKEREARLLYVAEVIGRTVESSSELTKDEAGLVIATLEAAAAERSGHDEQP